MNEPFVSEELLNELKAYLDIHYTEEVSPAADFMCECAAPKPGEAYEESDEAFADTDGAYDEPDEALEDYDDVFDDADEAPEDSYDFSEDGHGEMPGAMGSGLSAASMFSAGMGSPAASGFSAATPMAFTGETPDKLSDAGRKRASKQGLFGGMKLSSPGRKKACESAPVAASVTYDAGPAGAPRKESVRPVASRKESAPAGKKNARKLEDVIGNLDKSFMELVYDYADMKGLTDPELQKRALIDRKAYSKLKCGTTKNPSKSTALAFAIALELNLDETKDLLSRAGLALSPCSKQDMIVQYFIESKIYDMYVINYALDEYGEMPLGTMAG